MSKSSDSQYLESKILTASQPRLHLILLEGAIRFGQQAKQKWNDETPVESERLLNRMMDVVEELTLASGSDESEISKQLVEQYAFLYRELGASRIHRDLQKLDECLQLLEFHRQTWKLACEKVAADSPTPSKTPVLPPHRLSPSTTDSFSLEA
jgi:flagellar protein FliS